MAEVDTAKLPAPDSEANRDLPRLQTSTSTSTGSTSTPLFEGDARENSTSYSSTFWNDFPDLEFPDLDIYVPFEFDFFNLNLFHDPDHYHDGDDGMHSSAGLLSDAPPFAPHSNDSVLQNGLPSAADIHPDDNPGPASAFSPDFSRAAAAAAGSTIASMEVATAGNAPAAVPAAAPDATAPSQSQNDALALPLNDALPPFEAPAGFPDTVPPPLPIASMPADLPILDAPIALDQPMTDAFTAAGYVPDMTGLPMPDLPMNDYGNKPEDRLSAFARLRFSDGNYYMHTYQIILGRNVQLARKDMLLLKRAKERGDSGGETAGRKRKRAHHRPRSVISNTGGIVNAAVAALPLEYQQRRQSVTEKSHSSNSNQNGDSNQGDAVEQAPQDVLMEAFAPVPQQLESHVPEDPHTCPTVPIHPPDITAMATVQGPKGISRQHAKIAYNFDKRHFELEVLSRNGLYHEDEFYRAGSVVRLNHGDTIVIGAVDMTFTLPEVALTDEDRARQGRGGSDSRPMSFSFENGQGELESEDMYEDSASEGTSVNPRHIFYSLHPSDSDGDDMAEDEDMDDIDDDDDDDEPPSPVPRHKKKHVHKHKPAIKQKLKISLKNKPPPPPPQISRKESKNQHKRKAVREPSPESPDEEPLSKRAKKKPKEIVEEPVKEKGKAPVKSTSKAPAKEPVAAPSPEKPEPQKTPKSESPTLVRKPTLEGAVTGDDAEQDGIITAEIARQHGLPDTLIGQVLEKRKGPGRPPKDGVMSKRQRAQLIKHHKEMEKAKAAGIDITTIPAPAVKPKIARARKDSTSNLDGDDDDVRETTEKGENAGGSSDKKTSKPSKPPRTPSPELRMEDYTEEQLQRPSANYVVLIHEAISSSATGQMNLQQIYNYIEKKYPWYKFKTTTSGWQSSVRHNLGQHDAFVKGDKEGKGYNWKINPEVSIEKERRKRQVSPQANQVQRQGYYPPPNGYPAYGQPGAPPFYPGMPPQAMPNAGPRPPPSVESVQPRLPPSLARNAAATPAANNAPNPSPYSSPWAGGNPAGSPAAQQPPRPYPPPHPNAPPPAANGTPAAPTSSGQYGVLMPTSGPYSGSPYGNQYATAGASPYANGANRTYSPYAANGQAPQNAPPGQQPQATPGSAPPQTQAPGSQNPSGQSGNTPHPSGRYPVQTDLAVITQLEAFRTHYLEKTTLDRRLEEVKVDNAIRAVVNPGVATGVTDEEQRLVVVLQNFLSQIGIKQLPRAENQEPKKEVPIKQEETSERPPSAAPSQTNGTHAVKTSPPAAPATTTASAAAAIAASDAAVAASVQPQQSPAPGPSPAVGEPASMPSGSTAGPPKTEPDTSSATAPPSNNPAPAPAVATAVPPATTSVPSPITPHTARPSVEPLTPVPGSPATASTAPSSSLVKQALTQVADQAEAKVETAQMLPEDSKAGASEETPTAATTVAAAAKDEPVDVAPKQD